MPVEYAPRGLVGVLTPQANTTAEPEFAILWPPGFAMVNARLTSPKPTIEARLLDYLRDLPGAVAQFANAPIDAFAFACTGASYFAGPAEEDALVARMQQASGRPVVTSARAVTAGLRQLGAARIGLVSPYPPALTEASVGYWRARGFDVAAVATAGQQDAAFHPIYAMRAGTATEALLALAPTRLEAIVMLGTGMPTLAPVRAQPRVGGAPVLSCMLATAWATVAAIDPAAPTLSDWITGAGGWPARLAERLPQSYPGATTSLSGA